MPKVECMDEPKQGLSWTRRIEVMYDLMVAALQTDSTRVMTYRMPAQALLTSMGINPSAHNVSHYSGERLAASKARIRCTLNCSRAYSTSSKRRRSRRLEPVRSCDPGFGSNISSIHYLDNCPTIWLAAVPTKVVST